MTASDAPLIGRLLVAAPSLRDPNFVHSVVLLLDHGPEGALGVILNRPSDVRVEAVLPDWAHHALAPEVVFVGGPVQTDALVGLARGVPGGTDATEIMPGIAPLDLSSDPAEQLAAVEAVRLFAGYAGWTAGQLESEIEAGGWFVLDGGAEDAFSTDPEHLWRTVLVRQGGVFRTVPPDPSLN